MTMFKETIILYGLTKSNTLIGSIIEDLISIEKKSEYEILLEYVDKKFHK